MCGLVSVVNKKVNGFTKEQQDVFSTLLYLDYLRGSDSTGVFLVQNDGDLMLAKEASNPIDFMGTKEFDSINSTAFRKGSALVGHNRKATRGVVNDENAHPFVVEDKIVLVHNGTMYGDHKKLADVEVDSHAIAHAIHESEDIEEALGKVNAAYALIWFDFENGILNFTRNSQRPLWVMETNNEWIYASEKCMLEFVRLRHGLKTVKDEGPLELKSLVLQQFKLNRSGNWDAGWRDLKIKWPEHKPSQNNFNNIDRALAEYGVRRRHPYEFDPWGYDDYSRYDDLGEAVPQETQKADMKPAFSVMVQRSEDLMTREREMMKRENKKVTNGEYHTEIMKAYPYGTKVHAIGFDYLDIGDGYYMYLHAHDDPDAVFRLFWKKGVLTEEQVIQMAGTGYVYQLEVETKAWFSAGEVSTNGIQPTTPGYVILDGRKPKLVYGGGIGDPNWMQTAITGKVVH